MPSSIMTVFHAKPCSLKFAASWPSLYAPASFGRVSLKIPESLPTDTASSLIVIPRRTNGSALWLCSRLIAPPTFTSWHTCFTVASSTSTRAFLFPVCALLLSLVNPLLSYQPSQVRLLLPCCVSSTIRSTLVSIEWDSTPRSL